MEAQESGGLSNSLQLSRLDWSQRSDSNRRPAVYEVDVVVMEIALLLQFIGVPSFRQTQKFTNIQ